MKRVFPHHNATVTAEARGSPLMSVIDWLPSPQQFKDTATGIAVIVGGAWALWRFGYTDWLRRRAEISSLEGISNSPELCPLSEERVAVSLRWTWRNAGSRPVYVDDTNTIVEVYQLSGETG